MKRTVTFILFSLFIFAGQYLMGYNTSYDDNRDVPLKKDETQPQPRRLPFENVEAKINAETLIIITQNYSGNVQVTISGKNGCTHTYSATGLHSEFINLTALEEGYYILTVCTVLNTYTGEFEW